MNKLKACLISKDSYIGYLYFYIHLITEITCFYFLYNKVGDNAYLWTLFLMYDALAFVPQGIIGHFVDKHKDINIALFGNILLILSTILLNFNLKYIDLIIICIGNCFIHVSGGVDTLTTSKGKLFPSAIFVGGGSFGVIIGRLLAIYKVSSIYILILLLTMIPFIILAKMIKKEIKVNSSKYFNYHNNNIKPSIIIFLSVLIVIIRGYMGYGIPMSWHKTIIESVYLFFLMGIGKSLGGLLSDLFGIKKIAIISVVLSLPFLILGNNLMLISLFGVLLFSMTMSITLAVIYSALKNNAGLSFGLTTIGLFLGTLPTFFFKLVDTNLMYIVMISLTIICLIIISIVIRSDKDENNI